MVYILQNVQVKHKRQTKHHYRNLQHNLLDIAHLINAL